MVTIWVHRNEIENFISVMERVDFHEEIEVKYYTYRPQAFKSFLQLFIPYDEFIQLEEKNVVNNKVK
jgi:hypothetical protein